MLWKIFLTQMKIIIYIAKELLSCILIVDIDDDHGFHERTETNRILYF